MILLIIGGSGSGKSEYAEKRTVELAKRAGGRLVYIATMEPYDEESYKRIERHRQMRKDKNFITMESYTHIEKLDLEKTDTVLLECISNLTANEMYSEKGRKIKIAEIIFNGIKELSDKVENIVIVGNNVFEDGFDYDASTGEYMKEMAILQNRLAQLADQVIEVVCGIPVVSKERG